VDQYHPGELTLNSFLLAMDWAEKQDCRIISFAGGEPTLHPLAKKFFEEVRLRGLRTYFNSNLLCDPDVISNLDGSWVTSIGIHAQAVRFTPREQRVHFERNVEGLRSRGVPLFLRYTFESQNEEAIGDALTLARTLGVKQANFAIPMPSLSRRNRHAGEKEMRDSGHFLVRATEAFRAADLTAILSKPIPPCAVPEDKLEFLRAGEALSPACNISRRGWTQNVLVAPDLTISPCVGVATAGPSLLDFQSFQEVSKYLVGHLQSILRPMPFEDCATCNFHLDGRCLGGCLAYFVEGNHSGKEPLSQLRA
jgi:MoaA/NifB/PqqE/SkfB family radical SAM enzyme